MTIAPQTAHEAGVAAFAGSIRRNAILAALPAEERRMITDVAQKVTLKAGEILYEPGRNIDSVHLVDEGMVLLLTPTSGGGFVQTAFIGRYGIVGAECTCPDCRSISTAMVQVGGEALRIPIPAFQDAYSKLEQFRARCDAFKGFIMFQAHQNAACYAKHSVENRICRWLLQAHDLTGLDPLPVTQDFLGHILAVRRSSVSITASKLKRAGSINHKRGNIHITDPAGIKRLACSCYSGFSEKRKALIENPHCARDA
jgi:CRP-like cAMP-binding protein